MSGITCPSCGSSEVHCRSDVFSPKGYLASLLLHRTTAIVVSIGAFCGICVNLFMLDAGNITPAMAWMQIAVALLLALVAWAGAWRGSKRRKRALRCRCLLCGEQWEREPPGSASQ